MKLIIDISKDRYDEIMAMDWRNCRRFFDEEIRAIHDGMPQRTGHWIETAEEYYKAVNEYGGGVNEDTPYFVDDIACSECLSMFSVIDNETERFDCCPHCGANMVDPQERNGV